MTTLEMIRRVRDEALEEAARVAEDLYRSWDVAERLRARKVGLFTAPTPPAVLRALGVDREPESRELQGSPSPS